MTFEEALKILDDIVVESDRESIALMKAKKAIENIIPKKPPFSFGIFYCPYCYIALGKKNSQGLRFCKNCGQALDWSDAK